MKNTKLKFENTDIQIINWEIDYDEKGNRVIVDGENQNSLGIILKRGNKKAFLAGDINNLDGDEDRIKDEIGKINFMKLGHHGMAESNTEKYLEKLLPEYVMITNDINMPYFKTIDILDKINSNYYFSTQDEKAVDVIMSEDTISIEYENDTGWKFQNGKWIYIQNGTEINKNNSITQTQANNWEELYNIVKKGESARIILNKNSDWQADKEIQIKEYQKIELISQEEVTIKRKNGYKGNLFKNYGTLTFMTIGTSNKIIIDGNKQNIDAQGSIIENYNGTINLYGNIVLENNKKVSEIKKEYTTNMIADIEYTTSGSAIYSEGTFSNINIYGASIINNEIDCKNELTFLNMKHTGKINIEEYGAGIFAQKGKLNISNAILSGNTIYNNSNIMAKNSILSNIGATIYGAAIYSTTSEIKISDCLFSNNKLYNNEKFDIEKTEISNMSVTSRGAAISTSYKFEEVTRDSKFQGNIAKNNIDIKNVDSIIKREDKNTTGGAIYSYNGNINLVECEFTKNEAMTGGAIYLNNDYAEIKNVKMEDNTYNYGGDLYSSSSSVVKILNTDYTIKEDKYITNIIPETTIEKFKEKFNKEVTVKNDISNIVKTGMKIIIDNKEYTAVVIGDMNKDGKLSQIDLIRLKQHTINMSGKKLLDECLEAADLNMDGKVNMTDLVRVKQFIIDMRKFK